MAILNGFDKQKKYITDENLDHKLVSEWTSSDTVEFGDGDTLTTKQESIEDRVDSLEAEVAYLDDVKIGAEGGTIPGILVAEHFYSDDTDSERIEIDGREIQGRGQYGTGLGYDNPVDIVLNPAGGRVMVGSRYLTTNKRAVVFESVPSYVYNDDGETSGDPSTFAPKVMVSSEYQGMVKPSAYTLAKSVPSNAQFTDESLRQTASNINDDFRVLLSATADDTSRIEGAKKSGGLKFNPSTKQLTCSGVIQATDFVRQSSKYVKENIEAISEDDAMKVLELKPVTFDYIDGAKDQCGLIAEEVLDVLPNVVTVPKGYTKFDPENPTNTPSIDYSKLVPYLIKMIQMQQQEIDELKNK